VLPGLALDSGAVSGGTRGAAGLRWRPCRSRSASVLQPAPVGSGGACLQVWVCLCVLQVGRGNNDVKHHRVTNGTELATMQARLFNIDQQS
jgi:hypothetical protein